MILSHDLLTNKTQSVFKRLKHTKRIVDVGCGIRPCPIFPCEEHICIEPHHEYVDGLETWSPGDRKVTIVQGEAEEVARYPRADTTVLLLDVIEHMPKHRGEVLRDLLTEFEQAVIFTPWGPYEQTDKNPDCWGLNGGYWQKHRSAWFPEDFADWKIRKWAEWHEIQPVGALLAFRSPS